MTEYITVGENTYKSKNGATYMKMSKFAVAIMMAIAFASTAFARQFDDNGATCTIVCNGNQCVVIC